MRSSQEQFVVPQDPTLVWRFLKRGGGKAAYYSDHEQRLLFFRARNAIYHSLRALKISAGDQVLVPSYLCAAAVSPITAYGAEVVFYGIKRDSSVDMSDIEARIGPRSRALMAVHYFGFPQDMAKLRALCDQYGLALIEDCAHVLPSEGSSQGLAGDASVFSWRKFLPVYDGGELRLRPNHGQPQIHWTSETYLFTAKVAKNLLDQHLAYNPWMLSRLHDFGTSSAQRLVRLVSTRANGKEQPFRVDFNNTCFELELINFPMSRLSRLILANSDVETVMKARRQHYLHLARLLSPLPRVRLLFAELPTSVCPWVLPLFVEGIRSPHISLRQAGIPAATWGGVRPTQVTGQDFPDADFLYENLLFLPIHQSLTFTNLDVIADRVETLVRSGQLN